MVDPARPAILAIDLGSSSIKAGVCSPEGAVLGRAAVRARLARHPLDGDLGLRYEVDGMILQIAASIRAAISAAEASPLDITACAVTSQKQGAAILDERLDTLLLSPNRDLRAVFIGAGMDDQSADLIWDETGHLPSFLGAWARLQWLLDEEPEIGKKAAHCVTLSDWVVTLMTGTLNIDATNGVESGIVNVRSGEYATRLATRFGTGIDDSPSVMQTGAIAGELNHRFADLTGLPEGVPILNCGPDAQAGLVSLGATEPGDTAAISGWSAVVQRATAFPLFDPERRMWTGRHAVPGRWVVEANGSIVGGAYEWLISLLYGPEGVEGRMDELDEHLRETMDAPTRSSVHLVPPTVDMSDPALGFGGVGFPIPLALAHPDRVDIVRAAIDGFAFSLRANLERLDEVADNSGRMVAIGGGMTRTSYFTIAAATALGAPVLKGSADASISGAARLAATALGYELPGPESLLAIVEPVRSVVPDYALSYEEWMEKASKLNELSL